MDKYTGTALDPSLFEGGQSNTEEGVEAQDNLEEGAVSAETDVVVEEQGAEENLANVEFEVDGIGKVTPEQIKEWRDGNMMRSDYTRKTQELAEQRREHQTALELLENIRSNPKALKALEENFAGLPSEITPQGKQVAELQRKYETLELDLKLKDLRGQYGNFDEIALLQKATELKTRDLETVLLAQLYKSGSSNSVQEAKEQLRKEYEGVRSATRTLARQPAVNASKPSPGSKLSAEERRIATNMGISHNEYAKWKLK